MSTTLKEELERVSLIEQLEEKGYETSLAESLADIAYNYDENEEPAYVCRNKEELTKAIKDMLDVKD